MVDSLEKAKRIASVGKITSIIWTVFFIVVIISIITIKRVTNKASIAAVTLSIYFALILFSWILICYGAIETKTHGKIQPAKKQMSCDDFQTYSLMQSPTFEWAGLTSACMGVIMIIFSCSLTLIWRKPLNNNLLWWVNGFTFFIGLVTLILLTKFNQCQLKRGLYTTGFPKPSSN